jgi:hypothetical protein
MVLELEPVPNYLFDQSRRDTYGSGKSEIVSYNPTQFITNYPEDYTISKEEMTLQGDLKVDTIPGSAFTNQDGSSALWDKAYGSYTCGDSFIAVAQLQIPDYYWVLRAAVFGDTDDTETWSLRTKQINESSTGTILTGNIGSTAVLANPYSSSSIRSWYFQTSTLTADDTIWGASISYYTNHEGTSGKIYIPLNLPDNATLTEVIVQGNLTATNDEYCLYKVDWAGNSTSILGAAAQAIGTARKDIVEIIDNENYSYVIEVNQTYGDPDGSWTLYGAQVKYYY